MREPRKWKVFRSRLTGTWLAVPPEPSWAEPSWARDATGFTSWDKAFDFAFWEASRERQVDEVP